MSDNRFAPWRVGHRLCSGGVCLVALAHAGLTPFLYPGWSPDAVWFLGTGLGLLLLAVLNLTHIGAEPCRRPTVRLVRAANWFFALFGLAALVAVPEPQAFVLVIGLVGQAIAGFRTLPGPDAPEPDAEASH